MLAALKVERFETEIHLLSLQCGLQEGLRVCDSLSHISQRELAAFVVGAATTAVQIYISGGFDSANMLFWLKILRCHLTKVLS